MTRDRAWQNVEALDMAAYDLLGPPPGFDDGPRCQWCRGIEWVFTRDKWRRCSCPSLKRAERDEWMEEWQ